MTPKIIEKDIFIDDKLIEDIKNGIPLAPAKINIGTKEIELYTFYVSDKISPIHRSYALDLAKRLGDIRQKTLVHELHHLHNRDMLSFSYANNPYEFALLMFLDELSAHIVDELFDKKIDSANIFMAIKKSFIKAESQDYISKQYSKVMSHFIEYLSDKKPAGVFSKNLDTQMLNRLMNFYMTSYNVNFLKTLSKVQLADFNVLFKMASKKMYKVAEDQIAIKMQMSQRQAEKW